MVEFGLVWMSLVGIVEFGLGLFRWFVFGLEDKLVFFLVLGMRKVCSNVSKQCNFTVNIYKVIIKTASPCSIG